jgi:hypothetical protein
MTNKMTSASGKMSKGDSIMVDSKLLIGLADMRSLRHIDNYAIDQYTNNAQALLENFSKPCTIKRADDSVFSWKKFRTDIQKMPFFHNFEH